MCLEFNIKPSFAKLEFCSDNAAMIGRYAIDAYHKKDFIGPNKIDIVSTKKQQSGTLL